MGRAYRAWHEQVAAATRQLWLLRAAGARLRWAAGTRTVAAVGLSLSVGVAIAE